MNRHIKKATRIEERWNGNPQMGSDATQGAQIGMTRRRIFALSGSAVWASVVRAQQTEELPLMALPLKELLQSPLRMDLADSARQDFIKKYGAGSMPGMSGAGNPNRPFLLGFNDELERRSGLAGATLKS